VEGELETNLTNLELALAPGLELSGTLQMEGEASSAQAPQRKVRLKPLGGFLYANLPMTGGEVDASGNFTIAAIVPREYRVKVYPLPENGYLKKVEVDGVVRTNGVLDLSKTSRTASVKLVLSPSGGQIVGQVVDSEGAKTTISPVTIFLVKSPEEIRWDDGMDQAKPDGRFTLHGVAPGKYRLLAVNWQQFWQQFAAGSSDSTEARKRLFEKSEELEVKPGDRIARDFKLTPLEESHAKK
jgi:hypothetical protein